MKLPYLGPPLLFLGSDPPQTPKGPWPLQIFTLKTNFWECKPSSLGPICKYWVLTALNKVFSWRWRWFAFLHTINIFKLFLEPFMASWPQKLVCCHSLILYDQLNWQERHAWLFGLQLTIWLATTADCADLSSESLSCFLVRGISLSVDWAGRCHSHSNQA